MAANARCRLVMCLMVAFFVLVYYYYVSLVIANKKKITRTPLPHAGFAATDFNVEGDMGDVNVVQDLRDHFVVPPSNLPYNLTNPEIADPSLAQAFLVKRILNGQADGFFIECGARDGEHGSNTLMFEREYNWTGLLIEPSPLAYRRLAAKHRRAYISPTCLSRTNRQQKVLFASNGARSRSIRDEGDRAENSMTEVRCFPLYSYLLALNRKVIDYLSLDVGGSELEVLRTVPWYHVDIRVVTVEFSLLREDKALGLRAYMEDNGYFLHSEIRIRPSNGAHDFIFVKEKNVLSR